MSLEHQSTSQEYYEQYDSILLPNLIKMRTMEIILIFITAIGIFCVWLLFDWLNFAGVIALTPVVQLDYLYWKSLIQKSYDLTWIMIILHIILMLLRSYSHTFTKIPIERQDQIKKEAKNTSNEKYDPYIDNHDSDFGTALRNPYSYYIIGIFGIGSLISYLNYFPRGEQLFVSLVIISDNLAIIYANNQYSWFFRINIVFDLFILMLFLFQFFFSLRQLKDLSKVINEKQLNPNLKEGKTNIKEDWKPPLPKPWNLMTITEKKEYKAQLFSIEKQRAIAKEQEKLAKFIEIEREKRRLGEGLYKEQQKEQKFKDKIDKLEKKKKKEQQKDRGQYDFR